jgi:hypothetical protein
MAAHTPWGPRPGENHRQYLERLNQERLARQAAERGDPPPAAPTLPVAPAAPTLPVAPAAAGTPVAPATPDDAQPWQKVGRAIGAVASFLADKVGWQRGRVFNPKILSVNVKPAKAKVAPPANWARDAISNFAKLRVINEDISLPYFQSIVQAIETVASDGLGYVQRAYASIGRLARLGRTEGNWGRETVRKAIRWLEAHGWIGTLNTLYRDEDRTLKRDSNVYLLFGREDAEEAQALDEPAARTLWRESRTLSRGAAVWGLQVRPYGLNATSRVSDRTNPDPA